MRPIIGLTTRTIFLPRDRVFDETQAVGESYLRAVVAAGGLSVAIPASVGADAAEEMLGRLDGVVLTGGGDPDPRHWGEEPQPGMGTVDPVRDEVEIRLCRLAVDRDVPLLGICRGVQMLNVALGGGLIQHLDPAENEGLILHEVRSMADGPGHSVEIVPGTRLAGILGVARARVTSSHHQAIGRVATDLVVSARAPDGVIEALEHPARRFLLGVQWHPERAAGSGDPSAKLLRAFVAAAGGGE